MIQGSRSGAGAGSAAGRYKGDGGSEVDGIELDRGDGSEDRGSAINLVRLKRWCGMSLLPAAYGALLSRFARRMTRPELAHVYREALDLFGKEQTEAMVGQEALRHLEWRGIR